MTTTHTGLPVAGYQPQSDENVELVNSFKRMEEQVLREMDVMRLPEKYDQRWLAVARTHIEQGFMALKRSVFQPGRVRLPADEKPVATADYAAGDTLITAAARAAHEANRVYCMVIGDNSQKHWDDAEHWQRDSAINGVHYIIENPDATPADQHQNWMDKKYADGWTWGDTKNEEFRKHPCLVPYDELPEEQRAKDELFGATVRAVLGMPQR